MANLISNWQKFLNSTMSGTFEAVSLLALRLMFGGCLAFVHGLQKLQEFSSYSQNFPDPLNVGSPALSLSLAIFGELVCGALVCVGFLTRLAVIPALFTMVIAFFQIHGDDPFQKKELALAYLVGLFVLLLKGAGSLSLDGVLGGGKK